MADKKTAKKTDRVNPIVLRGINGNSDCYVLEFSRDSVKFAEDRGFSIAQLDDGISINMVEDLFYYAFRMHHPKMSKADTTKILYDELHGLSSAAIKRLVELFGAPYATLIRDDDEVSEEELKNARMTIEM